MKLHLTQGEAQYLITGADADAIYVNQQRINTHCIVAPQTLITPWVLSEKEGNLKTLCNADFDCILVLKPEVVLLGTGQTHQFLHPKQYQHLSEQNIALECMTTVAACRTYNILVAEGRQVVAALLVNN